jgi:hypothetical protein
MWAGRADHPGRMVLGHPGRAEVSTTNDTVSTTNDTKEGPMTGSEMSNGHMPSSPAFQLNSGSMILGAALVGASCVLGLTGMTICGSTMMSAARRWIKQMDVPPSELARLKWSQAKAATAAGNHAWQNGVTTGTRA